MSFIWLYDTTFYVICQGGFENLKLLKRLFGFEFGNWGKGLFYFFGIGGTNPARRSVPKSPSGGMHYCFNATGGYTCKNKQKISPA